MIHLKHGQRYRARIALGIFESLAGNDTIAHKLTEAGFTGVTVQGSGRTRWAFGVWNQPTQTAAMPDHIAQVDEV